MTIKH